MDDAEAGEQLGRELQQFRQSSAYGAFPRALQAKATRYASERRQSGVSVGQIASELGVRPITARAWCSRKTDKARVQRNGRIEAPESVSLVPLVVCADQTAKLELHFPDGTRCQASGVTGPLLAQVIDALRRAR